MESLGDDLLSLIVSKIDNPDDRKSFSQVCKEWLSVEGLQRSTLRVFEPELLPNFLPRFPNLLKFRASVAIPNSIIQFLPNTCPRLQFLNLNYSDQEEDLLVEYLGYDDIDDEGLRDIAKGCPDLETVLLRGRSAIGDLGVVSLVGCARNLRNLDLGFCRKVSDEALKSIAGLNNLETLNLQGCCLITDIGLSFLAEGPVCNTLIKLNLAECDRITDRGLINLREMGALEDLNLADCGPMVTDLGIEIGVGANSSLKKLNLSWLVNVNDLALVALARSCWSLEVLDLTGCELISGRGIRAFSNHPSLKKLVLIRCDNVVSGDDLEDLALGCSSLECIVLDKSLSVWLPLSVQENILRLNCVLDWK
ncbi:hypothetical protein CDL12_16872 [Handroanthus impetiginosus]|uniref:Uncharacterized protein n=1 Tax=Handroanthus impetiginosus TaxID=429701 RepID=A0A2G9GZ95_9LAMI|nr:hypothetical protein CDL12_16872 [Handroanthus impetiginosus]